MRLTRDRGLAEVNLDEMSAYELVGLLERNIPELEPNPGLHSAEDIWHYAGARQLVLLLKNKVLTEQNNALH